jgi:hypothetical protein
MAQAVDLDGEPGRDVSPSLNARRPPAWHGTILPASDADIWLASAFSEYERIVALDRSVGEMQSDGPALARFAPISKYLAARARRGSDLALSDVTLDVRSDAWYDIASGKGVLVLDALRRQLGAGTFDAAMDEFGRAHAGKPVSTDEFFKALKTKAGGSLKTPKSAWIGPEAIGHLDSSVSERLRLGRFWSVTSFDHDPDRTKIVYRTASDGNGNREAALRLQHLMRRRWSNITIPVLADSDLKPENLRGSHLVLIGEIESPDGILDSLASPALVHEGSFRLLKRTYANPKSAVVVAVSNPADPAYSVVKVSGLSAEATWQAVHELAASRAPTEVLLIEAGGPAKPVFVPLSTQIREVRSAPEGEARP